MIAYNSEWLDNAKAQEQIDNAFAEKCISQQEKDAATASYHTGFYTPNVFIRAGLFILTLVIVSFSLGLLALMFLSGSYDTEYSTSILCVFFGIACYVALEWMVRNKHHYQSGVDDALLWVSAGLVISGLNIAGDVSLLNNAILISILAIFLTIRFADRLMAVVAVIAVLAVVFFMLGLMGNTAKAITPFVLMLVAVLIYFISKKISANQAYRQYQQCLTIIEIAGLICFYIAGNYFVVREASIAFFNLQLSEKQSIPFGWLFWIFTAIIPLVYIARGIQKKDAVLLRTGVLLIAAIVFTVRCYYHVLPMETAMVIGGLLLIGISYALIKLLKEPRAGFTSQPAARATAIGIQNIEAILIAETLSAQAQPAAGTQFGGGSFGGGGASGEF